MKNLVVAMDGPSGSGKSSTSRGVAARLLLAYLDTGSMYRAMTWAMLQQGIDVNDHDAVAARAAQVQILSGTDPLDPTIEVDGTDVAAAIRTAEVTAAVSAVSAVPQVRAILVDKQRAIIDAAGGIVVEGRDIGSTVAPDAAVKVYLVADVEARAVRRSAEMGAEPSAVGATRETLATRDRLDSTRKASPLIKADDAVVIDSTFLTLERVIDAVVDMVTAAR